MTRMAVHKKWVSPVTALSFLLVATTGLLMLFHVRLPGVKGVHEWMGVVLCLVGLLHLAINWRAFVCYFRHRSAIVALAAALLVCASALFLPGHEDGPRGEGGHRGRAAGQGRHQP
jgi:phosphatidylserine synthase